MNWFRLKTCIKCQGDLAADNGDWLCIQCGTYYYTGLYQVQTQIDGLPNDPQIPQPVTPDESGQKALAAENVGLAAVAAMASSAGSV